MPRKNPPGHNSHKLHTHPQMEQDLDVPDDHVIIDRDVYEALVKNIRHEMSFPPDMLAWLQLEAHDRDTSVAVVIRDAVLQLMNSK